MIAYEKVRTFCETKDRGLRSAYRERLESSPNQMIERMPIIRLKDRNQSERVSTEYSLIKHNKHNENSSDNSFIERVDVNEWYFQKWKGTLPQPMTAFPPFTISLTLTSPAIYTNFRDYTSERVTE